MDPITATGLISLGKNLIESTLLKPNGPLNPPDGKAFQSMLSKAGGVDQSEGIVGVLSQYGVHSLEDLRKLHADLRMQVLNDPAMASARASDPNGSIHLQRGTDGSYQAILSNGKNITFPPGSEVAQKVEALHHLSTFLGQGISTDRPGAIVLTP